jgi:hypothetical protein
VLFTPGKLPKGPVDQKKESSSRELKERSGLKGNEERSYKWILDLRAECVYIIPSLLLKISLETRPTYRSKSSISNKSESIWESPLRILPY